MRQRLALLAALLSVVGTPDDLLGGQRDDLRRVPASFAGKARIVGMVRDETGQGLGGVTVVALGSTLAVAKSAASGAFELVVPTGLYVLRALHEGYLSTFRESVRVDLGVPLERTITLVKHDQALAAQATGAQDATSPAAGERAPSEIAWRLRHLPRTVLRDQAIWWQPDAPSGSRHGEASAFGETRPLSLWEAADVTGHVDFLTTSSVAPEPGTGLPRGVAYLVVGAPVGMHGEWSARAALSPGEASAWTFIAEYASKPERRHAFRTGVAYTAQTLSDEAADRQAVAKPSDVRRVAGVHGHDRWSVGRGLRVSYGARLDRVDYLAEPTLLGGTVGAEQALNPRASVYAATTRHRVAPGASVFQRPASENVWLPPDRVFSPVGGQQLRAATVDMHETGLAFTLASASAAAPLELRVERFREITVGQVATLFGTGYSRREGHFLVATIGSVTLDGFGLSVTGALAPHVRGRVDYVVAAAEWRSLASDGVLAPLVGHLGLSKGRRLHDLTSSFEAFVPATETTVNVAVRLNDAFGLDHADRTPRARYAIEVRQPLPFTGGGPDMFTLFLGARTLQGDLRSGGYFDDLATVAPPTRVTGGIQVRF